MAHHFTFTVQVELERQEGKFAARDEMAERIREALEGANEGSIDSLGADAESTYEITVWEVEEV